MTSVDFDDLTWESSRLDEGLHALARTSGFLKGPSDSARNPAGEPPAGGDWDVHIQAGASRLGMEAERVTATIPQYGAFLQQAGPAIVRIETPNGVRFLLVLAAQSRHVHILDPSLRTQRCDAESLQAALCWEEQAPATAELERLLAKAGITGRRSRAVRQAMLRERMATELKGDCWLIRLPPGVGIAKQFTVARLPQRLAWILIVVAVTYGCEMAGWSLLGKAALGGRYDPGWFIAWSLLVLSLLPLELLGGWLNALLMLDAGSLLKQRLLHGVLRMNIDGIRKQGAGQLLGRVIESQAFETLALSGGFSVLSGVVELAFAVWVLSLGLGGLLHVVSILLWLAVSLLFCWRYTRLLRQWTDARLDLTHALVERMQGHRTCLVQEREARRTQAQDHELEGYFDAAKCMDLASLPVTEIISRGWLIIGIAGLGPGFLDGTAAPASVAIGLGGVLFGARALTHITGGITSLGRGLVAWERVGEIFRAGAGAAAAGSDVIANHAGNGTASLIEAQMLTFRYRPQDEPILRKCNFSVQRGEKILLEGPSGGGKSTVASLLVGLREATGGSLLLHGLDRHTLGANWRRHVAAAPQFHENHILNGSLAFNLLLGRRWPAADADLAEAEAVCRKLGLGELLKKMPSGLMQIIGETGWQLSHGERSRVYLARALLQKADLTVLDESFAALDPESLQQCLRAALAHTDALLVVAHP